MNMDQEYAVTFSRIQLPPSTPVQRLTISLKANNTEQFLLKCRTVKNQRANFYRQTLFISSISEGLAFQVYEITDEELMIPLKSFIVGAEELSSVNKRAAMFHTTSEQYEFVWECAVFSPADSELQNQQTDKEYSELLDLSEEETGEQELFMGTQSSNPNWREQSEGSDFRESYSTDQTFTPIYLGEKYWRLREDFQMDNSDMRPRLTKNDSSSGSMPVKRRCNIKSHIYSQLVTGISEFFSGGKL